MNSKVTIIRKKEEIEAVVDAAVEQMEHGTKYPLLPYEEGILRMYDWLIGASNDPPMQYEP